MCNASLDILENVVGCGGSVGVVDVGWGDVGYVRWGCGLCGGGGNWFGSVVGVCVCVWAGVCLAMLWPNLCGVWVRG